MAGEVPISSPLAKKAHTLSLEVTSDECEGQIPLKDVMVSWLGKYLPFQKGGKNLREVAVQELRFMLTWMTHRHH